ncbi:MAG: PleD family two-component system response regulator [Pseudomonadota bacterium]
MTGRILIVDDLAPNIRLLEAKLTKEYYEVITASSGKEALEKATQYKPDLILLDVMMPEMDGNETCQILKRNKELSFIPIVMVTALYDIEDKVRGLESGADDFLTKPINDAALISRVKSLMRLKIMVDELRLRNETGVEFGVIDEQDHENINYLETCKVLLVDDDMVQAASIKEKLSLSNNQIDIESNDENALNMISKNEYDVIIVSTQIYSFDGLRLCSQIRNEANSRSTPILILVSEDEQEIAIKGLELGVNDYLILPIDDNELIARLKTQIKRKRYQDSLKANYEASITLAIKDGLTGIYNRRYFDVHFNGMVQQAHELNKPLTLMILDIDFFKKINDVYGHQAGDTVLQAIANRLVSVLRSTDLVARYGGEEFAILTKSSPINNIKNISDRMLHTIANRPIPYDNGAEIINIHVTASIGIACLLEADSPSDLLNRADKCLYKAKDSGRNCNIISDEITEMLNQNTA